MIQERNPGRDSKITRPSTHNQRIDRLWRDVFDDVMNYFHLWKRMVY